MPGQHGDHRLPWAAVGVHQRSGQAGQGMQQPVLSIDRHPVSLDRAGTAIHDDLAFSAQVMPDPPQPDLAPPPAPPGWRPTSAPPVNQSRVDGIHQPAPDLPCRLPQHGQDRHRDHQSHHRVRPIPANRDASRPPSSTASEVNPSARACNPSAASAAEPILRPTRIRYRATASFRRTRSAPPPRPPADSTPGAGAPAGSPPP